MANNENECKDLNIDNRSFASLKLIFNIQKQLQNKIEGKEIDYSKLTLAEVVKSVLFNKHALEDELSELVDAIGGIKDGIGNAAWKWWKKDNIQAKDMTIADLSESDLKELKMEFVDILHFYINIGLLIGITGDELGNYYISKNKENIDRQDRGY